MKFTKFLTGATIAIVTTIGVGTMVSADRLSGCHLEETKTSASVLCTKVKKARGKDKLYVAVWIKCGNGTDTIILEDKSANSALKASWRKCPDDMTVRDAGWTLKTKP